MNAKFDLLNDKYAVMCVYNRTNVSNIGHIYNLLSAPVEAAVSILPNFNPLTETC